MSGQLAETTIITAFYPIAGKYQPWIKNLCKIPMHLIIFTTEVDAYKLYQWRREFLEITQIIVRPFYSFAMSCPSMMNIWNKQLALDTLSRTKTPEEYALWAMKQELVRIVIHTNRFQSKWFIWCDGGILRYSALQSYYMDFPSEVERLCIPGRMTFLEVNTIPDSYILDSQEKKEMVYPLPYTMVGGGCIVGDAEAWQEFGEAYKEMLKEFLLRGWFAGRDSDLYFAILFEKKARPFRLFHATKFGEECKVIEGIEWLSFPPILGGTIDAVLDTRFEE